MKALVTGGCGFVGRRFVRRLLNDGWSVDVIDNLSTGLPLTKWPSFLQPIAEQFDRLTMHYRDVRTSFRGGFLEPSAYDLIIHLAAVVGGRLKIEGDPLAVATDLSIDADFFNWVVRDPPRKVIYFSSSAVYPLSHQQQLSHESLKEELVRHPFPTSIGRPDATYGWSKLTGEYLAHHAATNYNLDVVIYRPFSGYGADQSMDYPFPSLIKRILEREDPITIWGSGDQVRDFIYIEDIVDIVMATKDLLKPGETLNLGSGAGVSFRQLVEKAHSQLIGSPCNIVCDTTKPEGVFYRVADTFKMLKFQTPPVIGLEEGIQRVARYLVDSKQVKV